MDNRKSPNMGKVPKWEKQINPANQKSNGRD